MVSRLDFYVQCNLLKRACNSLVLYRCHGRGHRNKFWEKRYGMISSQYGVRICQVLLSWLCYVHKHEWVLLSDLLIQSWGQASSRKTLELRHSSLQSEPSLEYWFHQDYNTSYKCSFQFVKRYEAVNILQLLSFHFPIWCRNHFLLKLFYMEECSYKSVFHAS